MRWLLLLYPSMRGRAYLQMALRAGLRPDAVIVQGTAESDRDVASRTVCDEYDPGESLRETLSCHRLDYQEVASLDPNHDEVVAAVRAHTPQLAVFSGGGVLEDRALSAAERWLHVHPGRLPAWRGSTCHYYGLLLEGTVEVTAFFLAAKLDAGEILCRRSFEPAPDWRGHDLDHVLDARLRAIVLLDALRRVVHHEQTSGRRQDSAEGQMFYVIHPVLKHLAVNALGRSCNRPRVAAGPHPTEVAQACPFC